MKKNKFAYLGFLGFLGFLAIPLGQYGLLGFFGFFGYFSLFFVKNDELLEANVRKASANAFLVSVFGLSITMALVAVLATVDVAMLGLALTFAAQMLTYSVFIFVYEKQWKLVLKNYEHAII